MRAGRGAGRLGVALVGASVLCGCLAGDPPPDPEDQPLEIVVGNDDPAVGPCLLNVDEVGAGTHEVSVIPMSGDATVRILDPSGAVVFEQVVEGAHQGEELAASSSARLAAGEHRVECTSSDGASSTGLRVVPARPGFEDDGPG